MKKDIHDYRMIAVYEDIYEDFYRFESAAIKNAMQMILKNIAECQISLSDLKNMNVLNVGTGRETLAFHKIGVKNVYHFDISEKSVSALFELKKKQGYENIHTKQMDICGDDDLGVDEGIDFVYLSGVLHHLHSPGNAMEKLLGVLNTRSKLFFRIYRSGSLAFFIVDFIRKFISWSDMDLLISIFSRHYDNFENSRAILSDIIDDFFVPVLNLYNPLDVNDYFHKVGFQILTRQNFPGYDHADVSPSGQGWSLYYYLDDFICSDKLSSGVFPSHVDQMESIEYKEPYIGETILLMEEFLDAVPGMDKEKEICASIELYITSQLYRETKKTDSVLKHKEIQRILKNSLKK